MGQMVYKEKGGEKMARVKVRNEVKFSEIEGVKRNWDLCLQEGIYMYDDQNSDPEFGFRFMYREEGKLRPLRGQARIPSLDIAEKLIAEARRRGWGNTVY